MVPVTTNQRYILLTIFPSAAVRPHHLGETCQAIRSRGVPQAANSLTQPVGSGRARFSKENGGFEWPKIMGTLENFQRFDL
jgi:hypothetical protein